MISSGSTNCREAPVPVGLRAKRIGAEPADPRMDAELFTALRATLARIGFGCSGNLGGCPHQSSDPAQQGPSEQQVEHDDGALVLVPTPIGDNGRQEIEHQGNNQEHLGHCGMPPSSRSAMRTTSETSDVIRCSIMSSRLSMRSSRVSNALTRLSNEEKRASSADSRLCISRTSTVIVSNRLPIHCRSIFSSLKLRDLRLG